MSTAAILGELDVMASQEHDEAIARAVEILQTGKMPDHEEIHLLCIKLGVPTHEFRQLAGVLSQRITDAATIAEPSPELDSLLAENRKHSAAMQQIDVQINQLLAQRADHERGFTTTQSQWRSLNNGHSNRQGEARRRLLATCDPRLTCKQRALSAESGEAQNRIGGLQQAIEQAAKAAEQAQTMGEQIKRWQKGKPVAERDEQGALVAPEWMRKLSPGMVPATPEFVAQAEQHLARVQEQGASLADHRAELVRLQTRLAEIENEVAKLERLKLEPASIAFGAAPALVKSGIDDGLIVEE